MQEPAHHHHHHGGAQGDTARGFHRASRGGRWYYELAARACLALVAAMNRPPTSANARMPTIWTHPPTSAGCDRRQNAAPMSNATGGVARVFCIASSVATSSAATIV